MEVGGDGDFVYVPEGGVDDDVSGFARFHDFQGVGETDARLVAQARVHDGRADGG